MLRLVFYILAAICLAFAALGFKPGSIRLGWLGVMLFLLTFPAPHV